MSKKFDADNPLQIGGQAVIEGVMMRGPGIVATAVRRSSGGIVIESEPFVSIGQRIRMLRLPIFRGAVGLIEMMIIGIRTLNLSAEISLSDEKATEVDQSNGNGSGKRSRHGSLRLGLTVALSLLLGIALFFVTPLVGTSLLFDVDQEPLLFNLMAGLIRVGLLLGYLAAISFSKEIRRLFEYHGAEHMAVFAFEKGDPLTVEGAGKQSRFHPRCGTSFLLVVMLSSILLFSVVDTLLIRWLGDITLPIRLVTHLPLIPLVGGISYEFIRASAKKSGTLVGRIVTAPGLWLQRLTTKDPSPDQLEVALAALRCALGQEEPGSVAPLSGGELQLSVN